MANGLLTNASAMCWGICAICISKVFTPPFAFLIHFGRSARIVRVNSAVLLRFSLRRFAVAAFRHTIFIARPVETVFTAVADVRTHPQWQAGLIQTEVEADHPMGVGTRGAEVRKLFGRMVRFPYEITVYDPPRAWGFRALAGPIRPSAVLTLSSHNDGTVIESDLTIPGPLGFLLGWAMLAQQKRNYIRLKELLETS